ncbi:MAG: dihydroorotate dehydrogenase [Streptosporangiales bacterium]|nr:dihydroorotate dehydrogenase [Streptosporangiales bacterium]
MTASRTSGHHRSFILRKDPFLEVEVQRLGVRVGELALSSPVLPASGCFGPELAPLVDVSRLGGVVTKTVFAAVRSGNPAHRLAEVRDGMLNSVGIPSLGVARWRAEAWPAYASLGVPVVVSLGGLAEADYRRVAEEVADLPLAAVELNLSCPNLEAGGVELGADAHAVERVVADVRSALSVPVFAKLTPNVASMAELARGAAAGGAAAVVVANTYVGMTIDIRTRRPVLGNAVGGWSGPASKPLVLRQVWQVSRAVPLPVIGCGGVATADDVVEYLLAGASAVQVGTATFTRPQAMTDILDDLLTVFDRLGVAAVAELVGQVEIPDTQAV